MKAIAWLGAALIQVSCLKINIFDSLMPLAQSFHNCALSFIQGHPSPWNWFYEAILIGRHEGLRSNSTLQSFYTLGLFHLIVGSGLRVLSVEKIIKALTFFVPPKIQSFFVVLGIILFSLFNRLQAACLRALISWVLTRKKTLKHTHQADLQLVVTCLCLCLQPQWATSLSFQLSCGATLGLAIASGLELKGFWIQRLGASLICTLTIVPLLFCIQDCVSWIVIPANILALPVFGGLFMPLSLLNIFCRPISFLTEPLFTFVFGLTDYFAQYEHPLLCMDERNLKIWGLIYLGSVYLVWRWFWPYWLRKQFVTNQLHLRAD